MGELVAAASLVVYPERPPVALNIKATEPGSFVVRLILESKDAWDSVITIAGSHGVSALVNFKELIVGAAGLIALIRKIGKRKVERSGLLSPHVVHMRTQCKCWTRAHRTTRLSSTCLTITVAERNLLPRSSDPSRRESNQEASWAVFGLKPVTPSLSTSSTATYVRIT